MIGNKFNIGDKVWEVTTNVTADRLPCPDCLGVQTWKTITGTGVEFTIPCPRCSDRYKIPDWIPPLLRQQATYYARELTIGSVRLDTNEQHHSPWSYMCNETGVGSGRIYYEETVFGTEAEARAEGTRLNAIEQAKIDINPPATAARGFCAPSTVVRHSHRLSR